MTEKSIIILESSVSAKGDGWAVASILESSVSAKGDGWAMAD